MEINLSYDQLNNEYSMLLSVLGASVSKHLMDEHFTCIWANDYYYELIRYPKSDYEALFHNRCDEYFSNNPEGWKLLIEKVTSFLEKGESRGAIYLPMIYPDGGSYWVKLQAAFTDECIDGHRVAYAIMTDVTELIQARQEQLYTQQVVEKMTQEQDMLMSALKVSVSKHLVDEHFTCIRANEYYYKLIGYSKERYEALFHNHPDEYYQNNPEGWEMLTQKVRSVLEKGGDIYEIILPMKYEDGSSYWVKLYNYFTDEYVDGFRISYTVMTDVTELVQMRNEQEILMRAMRVSVSRHLVDEHFTVIWANEFYYELIGYTKAEYEALFHNHCDEYFRNNEGSWDLIREKIRKMSDEGEMSYELFVPMKIPDGSTRWVKMVGFFTDEFQDGKQLAYTTMVDVTELMQTQQEKTIAYDSIPGFIVKHRILPQKIEIVDASDRIREIFDVDLKHLPDFDALGILQPESRALIEAEHPRFRRGEPFEGTICARDKYGKDRWFQIHCTCIDSIASDPIYLTVFIDITDITELRELQRKLEERTELLNAALKAAKQANAAKSDFLSRMSHDIRTPMNAIAGMTEIAGAHLREPERMKDCLQKIRLSSRHLLGLVNDVLDMSKIESGNFPINMAPFSLPELLREVIMITLPDVRKRRQIFDVHLIRLEREQYTCDALRIRQILLNLLSNACKFTPDGGRIVFDIEQLPADPPDMAALGFTVSDTGAGMKPEFLEHIFEAFTREQDSRTDRIEGSGLGMAITKRLVDLLGGSILVKSRPERGTTFQVTLPMRSIPTPEAGGAFPGIRVLLVDDDPAVLEGGLQTFAALGVDAECADNGEDAVARIMDRHQKGEDYGLVILDWEMTRPDGMETARRIRAAVPEGRSLLLLAAYDRSEIEGADKEAGADGFVEKPFFHSTLLACLQLHLKGETKPSHAAVSHDFSGKVFLLAEDNELNREIALELLGGLGAELETASNGLEALRHFQDSEPGYYDLILMDIQMPEMNGYEAARAIRALPREDAKTVRIIAMTADAFVEDIRCAKEAGMNGHISKPLDFESLTWEIGKYLGMEAL